MTGASDRLAWVEMSTLLQLISDVSKLNVVLLDVPPTPKLDVKAEDQPQDQLLDKRVKTLRARDAGK
jgi:hypothetical protein